MQSRLELTPEIIEELKQHHPTIYRVKLGQQDFVFRPITRQLWLQLQELIQRNPNMTPNDVDDRIVEYGLVWPNWTPADFMNLPAGYTSQLSRLIQARSGFPVPGMEDVMPTTEVISRADISWPPPTKQVIDGLKASYPGTLLLVKVQGLHFVVRPLLRAEWRMIAKQVDQGDTDVDNAVFNRAVVYPDSEQLAKIDSLPGIVTLVSNEVVRASGFDDSLDVYVEEL